MRPTITEQLTGIAAILRREVLPHLDDPFASSQLEAAAASLEQISRELGSVVEELVQENAEIESMLQELRPLIGAANEPLVDQLDKAVPGNRSQSLAFETLHKQNVELRNVLEQLVALVNTRPDELGDVGLRIHDLLAKEVDAKLGNGER